MYTHIMYVHVLHCTHCERVKENIRQYIQFIHNFKMDRGA